MQTCAYETIKLQTTNHKTQIDALETPETRHWLVENLKEMAVAAEHISTLVEELVARPPPREAIMAPPTASSSSSSSKKRKKTPTTTTTPTPTTTTTTTTKKRAKEYSAGGGPMNWTRSLLRRRVTTREGPGEVTAVMPKGWIHVTLDQSGDVLKVRPGKVTVVNQHRMQEEETAAEEAEEWAEGMLKKLKGGGM